jgi:hypothetical protein
MRIAYGEIGATGAEIVRGEPRSARPRPMSRRDGDLPHWYASGAPRTMTSHIDGRVAMTFGLFSVFGLVAMLALVAGGVALLPALLAIGAVVLAFSLAFHVIGFVFRLFGVLLLSLVAIPLLLAVGGLALALGIAMLHLALPLIVVIGVIWLIAHHHKSQQALPRPN